MDFFGIGEHHTDDFPLSAGDVVLGAIAARTSRIHLGSAVTVLSSDDPVRVFQRYSTLNAISSGRAEVILGRGSSIDSFPLFGYDLADYEELFEEKASLFAELLKGGPVTWQGKTRASLYHQDVVPHTESGPFPVWIGVGGSPQSVIRAARLGFSLMLAIIGGSPVRFAPFSQLFQQALERFGRPPLPVGVHSPGHVDVTDEQAREEFWPRYLEVIRSVSKTRGFAVPTKESFLRRGRAGGSALRRIAGDRRPEDRGQPHRSRRDPLRPEIRHGRSLARSPHDQYRAVRHAGGPARSRTAGLRGGPLTRRYEWLMTGTGGTAASPEGRGERIMSKLRSSPSPAHRPPREAERLPAYDSGARSYDRDTGAFQHYRDAIVEALPVEPGQVVLDVGCGTGLCCGLLRDKVGTEGSVVGIEESPEMAAVAREHIAEEGWRNVTVVESPAEEAEIAVTADAALFCAVHDILQSPDALRNVMGSLRPGAWVAAGGGKWAPPLMVAVNLQVRMLHAALRAELRRVRPAVEPPGAADRGRRGPGDWRSAAGLS